MAEETPTGEPIAADEPITPDELMAAATQPTTPDMAQPTSAAQAPLRPAISGVKGAEVEQRYVSETLRARLPGVF